MRGNTNCLEMLCIANICVLCRGGAVIRSECDDDRDRDDETSAGGGRRPALGTARRRPDGPRTPALQVDGPVQHHAGHAVGGHQRVDRADLTAGDLPRHRAEPAGTGERQLSAVDAHGLPRGDRGARGVFGRLGDMFGRVRIYNLGFVVFTLAAIALSFDPFHLGGGAMWLIAWRVVQGVGGAMLMASSSAILTDAFPSNQRGMALGVNMVAAVAGSFLGLLIGGVLSESHWQAIFWVGVPIGVIGTVWSYRSLKELGVRTPGRLDWAGTLTFAIGLTALLTGITYGIQPYGDSTTGWTNPWVLGSIAVGVLLLVAFCFIELRVAQPMVNIRLFRSASFGMGNLAGLMSSVGRGGLQFMLIIWLQGIWLPLHGYSFESTPLWAGIYLLPATFGFLVAAPVAGTLADRFGARPFTVGGMLLMAVSFIALVMIPVNFDYWVFAILVFLNGLGGGIFTAPNTAAIMSSVPAAERGAASGVRATFFNAGSSLSIGIFFSLMIVGLANTLPSALSTGLQEQGVSASVAHEVANLPPVGSLFAAFLGYNPIAELLEPYHALQQPGVNADVLTGQTFFPHLITEPFHSDWSWCSSPRR